jgi:hypothetical protein
MTVVGAAAFVFILGAFANCALAETWSTVYQTDFSTNPGWTTNAPSNMYWDSTGGRYHLQNTDSANQYTYVLLPTSSRYKLEFDLMATRNDWAGDIRLGLGDSTMGVPESNCDAIAVDYWKGDLGNGTLVRYHHSGGGGGDVPAGGSGYQFLHELNVWYHNVLTYDSAAGGSISWQATRVSDGTLMANVSASGVGSFSGIDRIYSSDIGDTYAPGSTGAGYIDNIVVSTSEPAPVPEPVTLASGAIGLACVGAYLRRRGR